MSNQETQSLFLLEECRFQGFDSQDRTEAWELKDLNQATFTGRIYVYSTNTLTQEEENRLSSLAKERELSFQYRGPSYLLAKQKDATPAAFILHDSRDKGEIARPLAKALTSLVCPVWYDEYSLTVGDSLREKIDKGIRECSKCIILVTPNFLQNTGWAKHEFNSIIMKEVIKGENVILPVWHKVNSDVVYEYSPALANILALQWKEGYEIVAIKLYKKIYPEND